MTGRRHERRSARASGRARHPWARRGRRLLHRRVALVRGPPGLPLQPRPATSPERLQDPDRDYLLLSKGHDVPALYGTLAELGFFPAARLANHLSTDDSPLLAPQPRRSRRRVPLGLARPPALGRHGDRARRKIPAAPSRVFVVLGDGELDEGSIWEAALVASAHSASTTWSSIVDRNGFQANVATEELLPLEPLGDKLRGLRLRGAPTSTATTSPRWSERSPRSRARPGGRRRSSRGRCAARGCRSIERRADRWFVQLHRPTR